MIKWGWTDLRKLARCGYRSWNGDFQVKTEAKSSSLRDGKGKGPEAEACHVSQPRPKRPVSTEGGRTHIRKQRPSALTQKCGDLVAYTVTRPVCCVATACKKEGKGRIREAGLQTSIGTAPLAR